MHNRRLLPFCFVLNSSTNWLFKLFSRDALLKTPNAKLCGGRQAHWGAHRDALSSHALQRILASRRLQKHGPKHGTRHFPDTLTSGRNPKPSGDETNWGRSDSLPVGTASDRPRNSGPLNQDVLPRKEEKILPKVISNTLIARSWIAGPPTPARASASVPGARQQHPRLTQRQLLRL